MVGQGRQIRVHLDGEACYAFDLTVCTAGVFPAGQVSVQDDVELTAKIVNLTASLHGLGVGMNPERGERAWVMNRLALSGQLEPEVPVGRVPQSLLKAAQTKCDVS